MLVRELLRPLAKAGTLHILAFTIPKNAITETEFLSEPQKHEQRSLDSNHLKKFRRKWL